MKINNEYYWQEDEFITGDRFETIADYRFDILNFVTGDHGRTKINYPKEDLIKSQIGEINNKLPEIIYVYGHDIDTFMENIDSINHSFKVISHNSDLGLESKHLKFFDNEKIKKWFAQNAYISHDKITALPIGIARSKYPHGNIQKLSQCSKNNEKEFLVYKNFDRNTNRLKRELIDKITVSNGIVMSLPTSMDKYWNTLSRSMFSISPPGNGIDCHRIWESLYLKTVPIVEYHSALEQFKDLPILFIDDWHNITIKFLRNNLQLIENKHEKLFFSYWEKLIKQA